MVEHDSPQATQYPGYQDPPPPKISRPQSYHNNKHYFLDTLYTITFSHCNWELDPCIPLLRFMMFSSALRSVPSGRNLISGFPYPPLAWALDIDLKTDCKVTFLPFDFFEYNKTLKGLKTLKHNCIFVFYHLKRHN